MTLLRQNGKYFASSEYVRLVDMFNYLLSLYNMFRHSYIHYTCVSRVFITDILILVLDLEIE